MCRPVQLLAEVGMGDGDQPAGAFGKRLALQLRRAEFGDDAVVQAKLKDGHLPEARFAWEPLNRVKLPRNDLNNLNGLNDLIILSR